MLSILSPRLQRWEPLSEWDESFAEHLFRCVGKIEISLIYVIRPDAEVVGPAPDLLVNLTLSEAHGSVEGELIATASYAHSHFIDSKSEVHYDQEEETRHTQYTASISPSKRTMDDRGAFQALTTQYAGVDRWQVILKSSQHIMLNKIWKGQVGFPLEKIVSLY